MNALRTKLQLLLGEAVNGVGIDSSWKAEVQSEEVTLQHCLNKGRLPLLEPG